MKKIMAAAVLAGSMLMSSGAMAEEAVGNDYVMCSGDQLQIVVYGHPDLSTQLNANTTPYIVRPGGKLSFPLVGELDVNGKTVPQFTAELEGRLKEYLVDPRVSVNIMKLGSTRVYVFGEVKRPGLHELEKSHKLLDAIGKAEGFTEMAAKKKVFVIRQGQTEPLMKVNLNNFLTKGDLSQNVELQEGDCVYLTSNGKISFVKDIMPFLSGAYMISEIDQNRNE